MTSHAGGHFSDRDGGMHQTADGNSGAVLNPAWELNSGSPAAKREAGLRGAFRGFDSSRVPSPAFVVDKAALQYNLDILADVMEQSGAKIILALKGFSMFALGPMITRVLAGTSASSLHEARLGHEEFGGEVHVYAPAFTDGEMAELLKFANHIVFNSFSQWEHHRPAALATARQRYETDASRRSNETDVTKQRDTTDALERNGQVTRNSRTASIGGPTGPLKFGIRVNPRHSEGAVELYDPCAPYSRMGVPLDQFRPELLEGISGLHFHTLCEQGAEPLERTLQSVLEQFGPGLENMEWINLGGGHHITKSNYNRPLLIELVKRIRGEYGLEVYLEPGEAIAIHTGVLVGTVLDLPKNGMDLAILDVSATCHMPDVLEMPYRADIWNAGDVGDHPHLYRLGGQTCLAGDVIGDYSFPEPLRTGQRLVFDDMSHYTMVKTTTFNGIPLPAICSYDSRDGSYEVIKKFGYEDFRNRLS